MYFLKVFLLSLLDSFCCNDEFVDHVLFLKCDKLSDKCSRITSITYSTQSTVYMCRYTVYGIIVKCSGGSL